MSAARMAPPQGPADLVITRQHLDHRAA